MRLQWFEVQGYKNIQAPMRLADLRSRLFAAGARPVHVERILRAWMQGRPLDHGPVAPEQFLPASLRSELPVLAAELDRLVTLRDEHAAADGSSRLLLELADGQTVESVLLPRDGLCVSTQVGCAVGCSFCMTGRSGLLRQLGSAEIVAGTYKIYGTEINIQRGRVLFSNSPLDNPGLDIRVAREFSSRLSDNTTVGAQVQGPDDLLLVIACRRDDDGHRAHGTQHRQDCEAIDVRQPEVEHDDVRRLVHGFGQPRHPGRLAGHRMAGAGEAAQQCGPDRGVIFDDENAGHGGYATRSMGRDR